jgi:hypothetical protein
MIVALSSIPSFAVLGEDVSTVQVDQSHFNATLRVTQTAGYAVHELHSSSGLTVREYASPSGKVFAVAWHGPWQPDLKRLLGSRFEAYRSGLQSPGRGAGHGPVVIQQNGLVVELGGHMRDFAGRAYLIDQMPEGVSLENIR